MSVPLLTSFRISVTRMDDSFEENDGLATIETPGWVYTFYTTLN